MLLYEWRGERDLNPRCLIRTYTLSRGAVSTTHTPPHMERPMGLEPMKTYCLEGNCSIQLSYGRISQGTRGMQGYSCD